MARFSRLSAFSSSSFLDAVLRSNANQFLRSSVYCSYQISEMHRSSTSKSVRRNGNGRSEGRLHHFKKILKQFMTGSKDLGSDVKRLVAIRRKLKASGKDWGALSLDETLHINQVSNKPTFLFLVYSSIKYCYTPNSLSLSLICSVLHSYYSTF